MSNSDSKPYLIHENWHMETSLPQAVSRLAKAIVRLDGRVTHQDDSKIQAEFGSRSSLRIWGLRSKRFPMKMDLTCEAEADFRTAIDVRIQSDEGWYIARLPSVADRYEASFRSLIQSLQDETSMQ